MGKSDAFKDKTKAPNFSQIKEDLGNAPQDDVVFNLSLKDCPYLENETTGTSQSSQVESIHSSETTSVDKQELNDTYDNVRKLIDLHDRLQTEPDNLNEKYEELKQLGEEVSESISHLKSSADTVAVKNKNKNKRSNKSLK